jgi:hypothetical protein
MNPTSCLFGSRFVWAQTAIFPPNRTPKMPESQQFFFGLRRMSRIFEKFQHPASAALWRIFQQIKVRQPQYEERILYKPGSEQAGCWIHFCMKVLRTLKSFQIFKTEIKKSKTYRKGVDVLFKAYPMVPLFCRSNLAVRYLETRE